MIENIWGVFAAGLLLGAPSGFAPGPMLLLIISETLRHGKRAGAKVACIPLLTDAPIVLASGLLFTKITNMNILLGGISIIGSIFLFDFATNLGTGGAFSVGAGSLVAAVGPTVANQS